MISPLLSIIIPTFNAGREVGSALNSILSQDFNDYEIILIDGCSGDNTLDIIREYAKRSSSIKWSSQRDEGVYDAMNVGIIILRSGEIIFVQAFE